jgi:hypothetical protein
MLSLPKSNNIGAKTINPIEKSASCMAKNTVKAMKLFEYLTMLNFH